ncbi:RHS repeat-associated core domain-containing protein [Streptomyces sp. NPDC008121]|uniref:RHS repeat domain-containing protein n=1 Tax=Streptomyces sp. NPDC008121 TaxID=3364809 RepID=UPI0036EE6049
MCALTVPARARVLADGVRCGGWLRRTALATAVVMAVTAVPVVSGGVAAAASVSAGAGVSGAVAMGGGASGEIDEKTGALRTALPLVSLPGRGGAGVGLVLGYDQGAAAAGVDRAGLGQGIGLGKAFVDPEGGGTLRTASGGSFEISAGDRTGTGLKRYLLKDLMFREAPGVLAERAGLEGVPREFRWVLTYDDGRKNYFSADGDLIAEEDPFGHQSVYVWEVQGGQHRLVRAVDAWGQAVTFDYGTEGQVTVASPERSDGARPRVVLRLDGGRLVSVVDPAGQVTKLSWDFTPSGSPGQLLTGVEAPTGAVTRIGYSEPHGFPVASSLKVTDGEGRNLAAERTFTLDVTGEHTGHDFTGRGQYGSADELFDSADPDYRYATELSDGRSTVRSVFNSLHLLKERTASLNTAGELRPVRTQQLEYEGERDNGQAPPAPSALPANYGKPVRATVTVHDPATGQSRTTAETARFDEHGRQVQRTGVTGATTVTAYDSTALDTPDSGGSNGGGPAGYGLPLRTVVTGSDGAQAITENTLSADRRSITAVRELVKNTGEDKPSARTVTSYQVGSHGEVTGKTVTWAEGAEPEDAEGPDSITETYASTIDTAAHQRTDTATSAAGTVTQVTDLVTGQTVKATDAAGGTVTATFDEAGRPVSRTVPGGPDGRGLTTTFSYTPVTTTVSTPGQDGGQHITVEERDLLGRVVKQTDNVRNGELTGDPAARTLQTVQFEDEGRTAKATDGAGRTSVTEYDDQGRPVRAVAPNGMTQLTVYADAVTAHTSARTTLLLPAGESDPAKAVTASTSTFDQADRPVAAEASFGDGTELAGTSQSYDSLGRASRSLSQDIITERAYGPAGTPATTTLTPQNPDFPGEEITSSTRADLAGSPVVKTLTAGQGQSAESRTGTRALRNAAGQVTEEVRPDGKKTFLTYTPAGQADAAVSPGGTRTSYEYGRDSRRLTGITVTSADGRRTEKSGYAYDPYTGAVTGVFDPDRRDETEISYSYDADGNVTVIAYPDGKTVRQTFDDHGQRTSVTDTAGITTAYAYNPDGTLANAVQRKGGEENAPVISEVSYTYDGLGRIVQIDRGNGVTTHMTFTSASQAKTEKTVRGAETLSEASYTYDRHGNLTQRVDDRPSAGADGSAGPKTKTTTRYTYDAYSRLTGSQVLADQGHQLTTTRYTINVSGDVTSAAVTAHNGGQAGRTTLTEHRIDPAGRLTEVKTDGTGHAQTFDDEGNLLTDHQGNTYTYNLRNQPTSRTSPDGKKTTYTYWASGARATTAETSTASPDTDTARFYYAPGDTLLNDIHTSSSDPSAQTAASYLLAGTRESRSLSGPGAGQGTGTGAGYLIHDRHGNTTALTASDGTVSQAWNYTDYGQHADITGRPHPAPAAPAPAGQARNPFTFAGAYTSPEGTQYLKARTYDPATKRFTTADAAPLHNRYQAMDANPVMKTDPSGTTAVWDYVGYGISAAITIGAILLTFLAPPAGAAAIASATAGLIADTAGLVLESVALAHDATGFLGDAPAIRDGLFYSGMALSITGGITSLGSSRPALKAYKALKKVFKGPPASAEELRLRRMTPFEEWHRGVSGPIKTKYPLAADLPAEEFQQSRKYETTETVPQNNGLPSVEFADGGGLHTVPYSETDHRPLRDLMDENTFIRLERAVLTEDGGLPADEAYYRSLGDRMSENSEAATKIIRKFPWNTDKIYRPTRYVDEAGRTVISDGGVYPRNYDPVETLPEWTAVTQNDM